MTRSTVTQAVARCSVGLSAGATQVAVGTEALHLSRSERTVLASIALFHPDGVSADDLVELLWDDAPPATAGRSLHNHLARIRRRAPGLIHRHELGYVLAGDVDLVIDHADGLRLAPELPDSPAVERRRLMLAGRDRPAHVPVGHELVDGDPTAMLPALRAAVEVDPYDERAWFRLIAVLASWHGRDAGLVEADRAARSLASCGLEPGRRLRDLERLVRDGERDIARLITDRSRWSPPAHAAATAVPGMHAHIEWLAGLLDPDGTVHVQVNGPRGSGKSALVDLLALRAQRLGAVVRAMYGCSFDGLPLPLTGSWQARRRRVVLLDDVDRLGRATIRSLTQILSDATAAEGPLLIVSTCRRPMSVAGIDGVHGVTDHRIVLTAPDEPPEPVASTVEHRSFDPAVRRVLRILAISDLAIHHDDIDAMVPGPTSRRRAVLRTGLVRDRHETGHWTIVDDARAAVTAELDEEEIATLHRVLAAAPFDHDDETVRDRRRARHAVAVAGIDPAGAADALSVAAEQAGSSFDHRAAAALFDRASEVVEPFDAERSAWLRVSAGRALLSCGDLEGLDVLERVVDRALADGHRAVAARAVHAFCRLGPSSSAGVVDTRAAALADHVMRDMTDHADRSDHAEHVDHADRALVAGALAMVHVFGGDPDYCRRRFREALTAAEASHRDDVLGEVLPFAYLALAAPEDLAEREAIAERLSGLADRLDRSDVRWEAAHLRFSNQLQRGDPGCRVAAADLVAAAAGRHEVSREWEMAYVRATVAHLDGRLDDAEAEITASLGIAGAVGATRAMAVYGSVVLACRMAQDRVHELAPTIEAIAAEQPLVTAWQAPLALAAATVGDRAAAAAAFDRLVGGGDRLPRDCTYTAALTMLGEAAARLGDADRVTAAIDLLAPWSGRWAWTGTCAFGPIDLTLARLAEARGDGVGALGAGVAALRSAATMRSPRLAEQAAELVLRHA